MGALFNSVWISYDGFFKGMFGDGERTEAAGDEEDKDGVLQRSPKWWAQRTSHGSDVEYGGEKEGLLDG